MEQSPTVTTKGRRNRLLLRGESTVAAVGVALAAILFCAVAASAWWVQHTQNATTVAARAEHLRTVGDLLSQNAESLLSAGELSAVRRTIAEAGASYNLTQCRIVLADGQIIAASDSSQITTHQLPETWSGRRPLDDVATTDAPDGSFAATFPINVRGRGEAALDVVAPLAEGGRAQWEATAGVGAIGAAAMVGLLLTYRMMRTRIRAGGAIREALIAMESGETAPTGLCVSETLGNEAKTWNNLVNEREKFRKQGVVERARETLGNHGQTKGDLSAACDAMSQGLVLVDDKKRVGYANGAAAVFLRCKREELVGSDISRFLQVVPILESVREIVGGAGRRRTVHDIERKDEGEGAGVLRFSVRPVRRDDAAAAMITIEDITQQKVAEEARHAFVAQATHELRTPLTNIRLYVETAIDEGEHDPATRSKCLNVINGETRRLERIVGEMLSVAEIEAGSFKVRHDDVRLETVFEDLQADYAPQAKDKQLSRSPFTCGNFGGRLNDSESCLSFAEVSASEGRPRQDPDGAAQPRGQRAEIYADRRQHRRQREQRGQEPHCRSAGLRHRHQPGRRRPVVRAVLPREGPARRKDHRHGTRPVDRPRSRSPPRRRHQRRIPAQPRQHVHAHAARNFGGGLRAVGSGRCPLAGSY